MNKNKHNILWVLFFIILAVTAGVYSFLPEIIPLKWDFGGNVIKSGSRIRIFTFPLSALAAIGIRKIFPAIDPKGSNYKMFAKAFDILAYLFMAYTMVFEIITIHNSFIPGSIDMQMALPVIIGFFATCIGNFMPQFRHNYFVGIRTPWTLCSEQIWTKTHRFGGAVWFVCGILTVATVFLPDSIEFTVLKIIGITALLLPSVYSYLLYRRRNGDESI